jgi:dihydropyrimidine dehydrogenase (NAD+) subunit PreA
LSNKLYPDLETTFAGLKLRSPIGVGAVGRPEGANLTPEIHAEVLLKHADAGVGYIYIPFCTYVTQESIRKVKEMSKPDIIHPKFEPGIRNIRSITPVSPYGVEGLLTLVTYPAWMNIDSDVREIEHSKRVMQIVKKKKPEGVILIANTLGYGSLPDTYVDAAKFWEEQGADMIEVNLSCPAQASLTGSVEEFLDERFSPRWPGLLIGQIPRFVESITREVVKAVKVPVGVKLSPEIGFPAIVGIARRIRDAGAKYISTVNAGITIAPPDIYNRGKPIYPFMNNSAFSGSSGSWLRTIMYKHVAAIARFAPGIEISAAGGMVIPEHCVEAMMLGAGLVQVTTGMLEQGRSLLRRCNSFLSKFMVEQGYDSVGKITGIGQQYIKYLDELDMSPGLIKAVTDEKKCTNCGVCADQICTVRNMVDGKLKVDDANCTGCGFCTISCRQNAIRLEKTG